jgi:hypothetical protein
LLLAPAQKNRPFKDVLVSYAAQCKKPTLPSARKDAKSEELAFCREQIGTCLVRLTDYWNEDHTAKVWDMSVVFISTLWGKGQACVGIWLKQSSFSPNVFLMDHSYGLCRVEEAEMRAALHGKPELVGTPPLCASKPHHGMRQHRFLNMFGGHCAAGELGWRDISCP